VEWIEECFGRLLVLLLNFDWTTVTTIFSTGV